MEKFCDVILVTFFGDVIVMTSLKCSKVRFRHNQLYHATSDHQYRKVMRRWGRRALMQRLVIFENLLLMPCLYVGFSTSCHNEF